MSQPFLGQIRAVGFSFAPRNNAACDGQLLSIQQNTALFALLGTTYGGNGVTTFALPNLQGRAPIHFGTLSGEGINYVQGAVAGEDAHTLSVAEIPSHTHELPGVNLAAAPGGPGATARFAIATTNPYRATAAATVAMNAGAVAAAGQSQAHENRQPYLVVNFIIALQGIFPSRN